MCLAGELREMHTLIERPLGQHKYLRENENFIYEALTQTRKKNLPQSIMGNVQKEAVCCQRGEAAVGQRTALSLNFTSSSCLSLLVSCCHNYFILFNGMPKVCKWSVNTAKNPHI